MGPNTDTILPSFLKNKQFNLCIEIGVFEGATSNFLVKHLTKTGRLICIDPLSDQYITHNIDQSAEELNNCEDWSEFAGQYDRFIQNVASNIKSNKIELIRKPSDIAYKELAQYNNKVDLCYIDGDHRAEAVLNDGINYLTLCKPGGYLIFDDYYWNVPNHNGYNCGEGIDMFLSKMCDKVTLLHKSTKVIVKKKYK